MATLILRDLHDDVCRALEMRAAQQGRSVEAEIHGILVAAVEPQVRVCSGEVLVASSRDIGLNEDV